MNALPDIPSSSVSSPPPASQLIDPEIPRPTLSPWRSTVAIVVPGVTAMAVMFAVLGRIRPYSLLVEAIVGTLFMLLVMVPIIYLILLRPMRRELQNRAETARILREIRAGLESRVQERTVELVDAEKQIRQSLLALERTHQETMMIGELVQLLQACGTSSESEGMMRRFGPKLFPAERGAVYLYRASRNLLELATAWGAGNSPTKKFAPEDCWALRRGREHTMAGGGQDVCCPHLIASVQNGGSLCIPMMAQGEAIGLLVLESSQSAIPEPAQRLASLAAEQVALALANLQLREKLRDQAIRDPLTAMFNRRYFEETAARELLRAGESGSPVGVIMIDVDHFKRFNDTYGHEAGDAVLQRVGLAVQGHSRVEDIVCRYGGEEFVMLLPGLPGKATFARGDEIREAISELNVRFRGETLAKITISCGVAVFPEQGRTCADLVDAADHALYQAKQAGRNRVEIAA